MILQVHDNFLPADDFSTLRFLFSGELPKIQFGDKVYAAKLLPEEFLPMINQDGYDVIMSFCRAAYKGFDDDLRIHADTILNNRKVDLASVLYLNDEKGVTQNGTAFWKHFLFGERMPCYFTKEQMDKVLTEDANDRSKWVLSDVVPAKPNRFLLYDADLFHSKWPAAITEGVRKVVVTFYSKSK